MRGYFIKTLILGFINVSKNSSFIYKERNKSMQNKIKLFEDKKIRVAWDK